MMEGRIGWAHRSRLPATLLALSLASSAHAQANDPVPDPPTAPTDQPRKLSWRAGEATPDAPPPVAPPKEHAEQRPFAYLLDPTTPDFRDVSLEYAVGYASGVEASRPLPSTIAPAGAEHSLTLGYGVTDRFAPFASFHLLQPTTGRGKLEGTASGGARWQLTKPSSAFRLTVAAVAFREFEGSFGTFARLAASYDIGRLRLASNVHLERVFASDRDPVDVLLMAGVSYRALDVLRFGVEYVGQDLEEAFDDETEAEGGARHYVGPTASLTLLDNRLQLVAAAAAGIGPQASPMVGRLAMLATF